MIKRVQITNYNKGILFVNEKPEKVLTSGRYLLWDPLNRKRIECSSIRSPWLNSPDLDTIINSGITGDELETIDLNDHERGLVWVDGRFNRILGPGQYAFWKGMREVKVQRINAEKARFNFKQMEILLKSQDWELYLECIDIPEGFEGLLFTNGSFKERLSSGRYLFWKDVEKIKVFKQDKREQMIDIQGQDIMTQDNVSIRLNAVIAFKVEDSLKAALYSEDIMMNLYREAQFALRALLGTRSIENTLGPRNEMEKELMGSISEAAGKMGISVTSFGIRDVILPGDMKDLLNKVTEARKKAEANLIFRREEVAAMRSQANTARMLENNPVLMRLKELEVLEHIAEKSALKVILGNEKLSEKVVNLL